MRSIFLIRLFYSAVVIILLVGQVNAAQWPLEIVETMDDDKIVIFLDDNDIVASPAWRPSAGAPPLTIGGAIKQVHRWISLDEHMIGAQILEIELKPIHGHEQEDRWYYLFRLHTDNGGNGKTHYAIILFNGKVVPAIAEPAAFK